MDQNPYHPPQAALQDNAPETLSFRVRSVWVHGMVGLAGIVMPMLGGQLFSSGVSAFSVAVSLALTILFSIPSVRIILSARTVSPPWWGDALIYAIAAFLLFGVFAGDATIVFISYFVLIAMNLVSLVALCVAEHKHEVRAYTKGRRWVFVSRSTDEIV